jgi:Zn-dependent protease with chaperone function
MGFGKLPELIFGKAELGGVKPRKLLILLLATYILLTAIPTALLILSISQAFALFKILLLACLIVIFSLSAATKRKREFMKN